MRTPIFDKEPQDSYIHIPKTTKEYGICDYEKIELEKTFIFPLHLYCLRGDPKFCIFFNKKGHIAGMQLSVSQITKMSVN